MTNMGSGAATAVVVGWKVSLTFSIGERNQAMRKFYPEEFRLPMKYRHHQRGLFVTMVLQLLTW